MHVYLVRHAIAYERDRKRWPDDALRPLTPAGVRQFREAAAGIARSIPRPERVLVSPLVRARQTADILAQLAGWPLAQVAPELEPGRPVKRALAAVRDQEVEELALVGHEPHLTTLLGASVAGRDARAPCILEKGGAACLVFESKVRPGRAELAWLLTPAILRGLGGPRGRKRPRP